MENIIMEWMKSCVQVADQRDAYVRRATGDPTILWWDAEDESLSDQAWTLFPEPQAPEGLKFLLNEDYDIKDFRKFLVGASNG